MKIFKKILSIYHGYRNRYIKRKNKFQELYDKRLTICSICPHNKKGICELCGCVIQAKTHSLEEYCPANKWFPKIRSDKELIYLKRSELPLSLQPLFNNDIIDLKEWEIFVENNKND